MKNPLWTLSARVSPELYEQIEQALFADENKQRFLVNAIERELVRRKLSK